VRPDCGGLCGAAVIELAIWSTVFLLLLGVVTFAVVWYDAKLVEAEERNWNETESGLVFDDRHGSKVWREKTNGSSS
jgi:hypothetical protein